MNTYRLTAQIAGVFAAIGGLLAFLEVHALLIMPIWFVFPLGVIIGGIGGVAVGAAYATIAHRLPPRPWRAVAFALLVWSILLPSVVIAELRSPVFSVAANGTAQALISIPEIVLRFILDLLLPVGLLSGIVGWRLGGTRRAAFTMAGAGIAFALGPGHNIPLLGQTGGVFKEAILITVIVSTSSLILVELHYWLQRWVIARGHPLTLDATRFPVSDTENM